MRFPKRALRVVLLVGLAALAISGCDTFTDASKVSDLETEVFQVKATLDEMGQSGTTIARLQLTAEQGMSLESDASNAEATAFAAQATLTAMQRGGGSSSPNVSPAGAAGAAGGASAGMTPQANLTPSTGTTFSQTTTTTGIRQQDGCALDSTTVFDTSEDQIFVVTTLTDLQAGSVFGVRWFSNGTLFHEEPECWIPDSDWAEVCAYCSIVPDAPDYAFETGEWSVELLLDGQLYSQAQFQIVGANAGAGDDTMDDTAAQ